EHPGAAVARVLRGTEHLRTGAGRRVHDCGGRGDAARRPQCGASLAAGVRRLAPFHALLRAPQDCRTTSVGGNRDDSTFSPSISLTRFVTSNSPARTVSWCTVVSPGLT